MMMKVGKGAKKKKEENKVAKKIKTILDASFGTALCAFSANSLNQILERKTRRDDGKDDATRRCRRKVICRKRDNIPM